MYNKDIKKWTKNTILTSSPAVTFFQDLILEKEYIEQNEEDWKSLIYVEAKVISNTVLLSFKKRIIQVLQLIAVSVKSSKKIGHVLT